MSDDKLQKAKNVLNQSRELFRKIVAAYAKISTPESVDIRLEEVANNFSLGIDECERSVEVVESFDKDIQVTSYITVDMKEVIQNIRGCLGCLSKSSNNYKNLAFTRPNRFFITTYLDGKIPKNIADQLLILLPSDKGLCLVIDKLYGFHSLDVLKNHLLCALKKISDIATPIKICIPKSSINSGGTNTNTFMKSIQSMCDQFFPGAKIELQNISIDSTYA